MVEPQKKSVVVVFDVYSTLLIADKAGNYSVLHEARKSIEDLKALGYIYLIAHASEDTE